MRTRRSRYKVAPAISIDTESEFTSWNNDSTVSVSVSDNGGSGLSSLYYKFGATSCGASDGTVVTVNGTSYSIPVPSGIAAGSNLCVYAVDALSQANTQYKFLNIDNVNPSISIDTGSEFTSWNNDATVGINVADSGSGVGSIYYKWGATSCSASNGTALTVVSGGGYTLNVPSNTPAGTNLCIYAGDNVANSTSTYKFLYIDNVAPSITIDTGSQFTSWSNDTTVVHSRHHSQRS